MALINRIPIATFDALPVKRKDAFRKNTYTAFDLTVGQRKNFPFIYRYNCYNVLGAVIFAADFGQPDFMALDKTVFDVPDVTVVEAESKEDFKKVAERRYASNGTISAVAAKCWQKIGKWLERLGFLFLEQGGIIMLTVAIVTTIIVVVLKIQERKI